MSPLRSPGPPEPGTADFLNVFFKGSPRAPHARAARFGGWTGLINKGKLWPIFKFTFPRSLGDPYARLMFLEWHPPESPSDPLDSPEPRIAAFSNIKHIMFAAKVCVLFPGTPARVSGVARAQGECRRPCISLPTISRAAVRPRACGYAYMLVHACTRMHM